MVIVWLLIGGGLFWLAVYELVFGIIVSYLYLRLLRDELMSYP